MSKPIILSDEEEENNENGVSTPVFLQSKKPRIRTDPTPTVFVIDDDPTPLKPSSESTPFFVPDTPMSDPCSSDIAIIKCTRASSDPQTRVSASDTQYCGISRMICLESDNEEETISERENCPNNESTGSGLDVSGERERPCKLRTFTCSPGKENPISSRNFTLGEASEDGPSHSRSPQVDIHEMHDFLEEENVSQEKMENITKQKRAKVNTEKNSNASEVVARKKMTKEERMRLMEEKKLMKEQEKLKKAALKAEAAELKKIEKERQKWEKGKFALKSIVAEIDTNVVESGAIGGHLLTRFAEKGLTYRIASNPIQRSIVWSMTIPELISQLSGQRTEVNYILLIYEAEEFCNLVVNDSLLNHVSGIRNLYPSHTVCLLTNRLMAYINKREQENYKNPANHSGWRRPPVEELMAKLTTHFAKVHSRLCVDEAELAEHVAGLTCSLASCQFRKRLTRLSVNANGSMVPKDAVDRNLIKKSSWLKALVAIPKVQPRFAIAIWKKYPTMKSLLSFYMDPSKSVHEKEFLLKDLTTEGLVGGDRRLGEVCSKRVYRILMARRGCIKTDDVENGADFFEH